MARQPYYEVLCQAQHPTRSRAQRGEVHGMRIGSATRPIRYTGRVLDDVDSVTVGREERHTAYCWKCGKATEYEMIAQQRRAS